MAAFPMVLLEFLIHIFVFLAILAVVYFFSMRTNFLDLLGFQIAERGHFYAAEFRQLGAVCRMIASERCVAGASWQAQFWSSKFQSVGK